MTSKDHRKHSLITRPGYGNFCRNEWAFMGTTCSNIQELSHRVLKALYPEYVCVYLDAEHANAVESQLQEELGQPLVTYVSHENHHSFQYNTNLNFFHLRQQFSQADVALVNGNHHHAKAQVLVIDEVKRVSLKKKLPQLTGVECILLADAETEIFDFVKEAIPHWDQLPVYQLHDTEKIIAFFRNKLREATPKINGLVLAGGQSLRMGQDKSAMKWHNREQRYYLADMLTSFCEEVFISCRKEQSQDISKEYKTLPDTFDGLGPYGALLSAFRQEPDRAWLVLASDLPLLDKDTLSHLISQRKTSGIATTYESSWDQLPEPLVTIWEPKSYPLLLSFLAQGFSCPRKVLLNNPVHIIKPLRENALLNVNTPEEAEKVKQILEQKMVNS